jgi:hypothetical protein
MKASEFKKAVGDKIRGHLGVEDKFVAEQIPAKIDEVYVAGQAAGGGAPDPAAEAVMAILRMSPFTSVDGDYNGIHGVFYSMDTPTHPGYGIIPAHVTEIANGALDVIGGSWTGNMGDRSLLLSLPEEPPISGGFAGWSENGNGRPPKAIYVPDGSVDAYKAAENWSEFANIIKPMSQLANEIIFCFQAPHNGRILVFTVTKGTTFYEWIESDEVKNHSSGIHDFLSVDLTANRIHTPSMDVYRADTQEFVSPSDEIIGGMTYKSEVW